MAADENLHMVFYRNLLGAAFELAPSQAMRAVADVLADFQMPGVGIDGFARKSVAIALAGIYDLRQHRDEVVVPVLRQWDVFEVTGLNADGEAAREQIAAHLDTLDAAGVPLRGAPAARAARLTATLNPPRPHRRSSIPVPKKP